MRLLLAVLLVLTACRSASPAPVPPAAGPFAWTIGDWRGERVEAASGEAAPMRVTVRPVLGGAGRLEELEVAHPRGTYRGVHLLLHDVERDVWVSHYANEKGGRAVALEGSAEGETFVWRSTSPERTRESQLVYERVGPTRWRRTQQFSEDGGAHWEVLFRDELERAP